MIEKNLLPQMLEKLNERKNRLLQVAQVGLSDNQFKAYRMILLDELGRSGFEKDLEEILRLYTERTGQANACKKGGAK
jgi:hypothetical protein